MATRSRRKVPQQGPPLIEADWSQGMKRDIARSAAPASTVWDTRDFMHDRPGMVYKRGGSSYFGTGLTGSTHATAVAHAPFPRSAQVVAIGNNGHLYRATAGAMTDVADLGMAGEVYSNPTFVMAGVPLVAGANDGALILAGLGANVIPKMARWNGTTMTVSELPVFESGPSASYKSRLVLTGFPVNPQKLMWAPAQDITAAWDANATIDADYAITGLAALQNALLVFSDGHLERITGSDPPPDTDMDRGVIAAVGCTDARSIVVHGDSAIFANPSGVYVSNGAGVDSLTALGEIESYWQSLFTNYNPLTWRIAAGLCRGNYVVSITDASRTLVDALICNIDRRAWARMSHIRAAMFSAATGAHEELYYASLATNRLVAMSGIFDPAAVNAADAGGLDLAPLLETRLIGTGPGVKSFGFGHITYALGDTGQDTATLAVSVAEGVGAASFDEVPESPMPETADVERRRVSTCRRAQGITIRIEQEGRTPTCELYALEVEQLGLPPGFGGV